MSGAHFRTLAAYISSKFLTINRSDMSANGGITRPINCTNRDSRKGTSIKIWSDNTIQSKGTNTGIFKEKNEPT